MSKHLDLLASLPTPTTKSGVGSTLAHYSDAGVRTVLVCATRGEVADHLLRGLRHAGHAGRGAHARAAMRLRPPWHYELRWLDWPDGGIKNLPLPEAIGQVVRLIREIRPDVIITHPENGLYPHPDHLAVWEIVRAAFSAAADPEAYPEAGPAWAASAPFHPRDAAEHFRPDARTGGVSRRTERAKAAVLRHAGC